MLIGYVRVSKSDGTQTLAPQRDAMLVAGTAGPDARGRAADMIRLNHHALGRTVSRPSY